MKFSIPFAAALLLALAASPVRADVAADLKEATDEGHPVFLVVTDGDAKGTDLALKVSGEAAAIVGDAVVVRLDRGDPTAAAAVKRYRLESVAVPLILVVASNGVAVAGSKPNAVTAAKLARLVPGPAKAAYMKVLEERRAAFLVFAAEKTPGRPEALAACDAAARTLEGRAATVAVDVADAREAAFLAEMKVDPATKAAVTVVVNARGQRTATFDAVPTPAALLEASKKVVEECCPGGNCK